MPIAKLSVVDVRARRWLDDIKHRVLSVRLVRLALVRLQLSLGVRPWLIDIACAIELLVWGTTVATHRGGLEHSGFGFVVPIHAWVVGACYLIFVLQIGAALLKAVRLRQISGALGLTFFGGLAFGVTSVTGHAAYFGWALAEALILVRVY